MSSLLRLLLAGSFLLGASSALPTLPLDPRELVQSSSSTPLPPSKDPFYTAPAHYESTKPGTVLRIRPAPGNLTLVIANSSAAYNILYRTTDSRYNPSWAVTTLFVPNTTTYIPHGSALLNYQIPYNSADVDSSPSYTLYATPPPFADIPAALGRGWYVNVPDFEGPLASFAAGVQEGHATLDSVRAALTSNCGLVSDARYAMWGYSGGALASEWAAELQVQYAPELHFSGLAIGGLTPNFTGVFADITGTQNAGLMPAALVGMLTQYPEAYEYLVSKLKTTGPYNRTMFLSTKDKSYLEGYSAFANQIIYDYFVDGAADLQAPIIQHVFDTNGYMGYHGVPAMPVFSYKAIGDEFSPVGDTDALVSKYCAVGANILYQRNTAGGHIAEETNGDARAFRWLSSVFDGTYGAMYASQGCTIQNVTIDVDSSPI